jgi:hypothetical protein
MKSAEEWVALMEREAKHAIQQYGVDAVDHVADEWVRQIQAEALEAALEEMELVDRDRCDSGESCSGRVRAMLRKLKPEVKP